MPTLAHRPAVDGLRAVAVLSVIAFHAHLAALDGGYVGVDLFFVLSGFLVTGVLLREVDAEGTLSLGGFYARRVRRLLPAAVVAIVATSALQLLVRSQPARVDLAGDARASLLYFANWHYISRANDYFAQDTNSSPFLHFWSLAIEEQFYVVFPLLLLLLVHLARRLPRRGPRSAAPDLALAVVLGVVVVVSVALQVHSARLDPTYAYYATQDRVYQLAAGALLMLLVRRFPARAAEPPTTRPRRTALLSAVTLPAAASVLGLLALGFTAGAFTTLPSSDRGLLATAAALPLLYGLWQAPRSPLARLLALPLPRYVGRVSYGVYLWHWPVLLVLERVMKPGALTLTVLTTVLATGLAALSFQVLENPVRTARLPRVTRWPVVATGLAVSALAAAFVVGPVLDSPQRPALVAATGGGVRVQALARSLDQPVPAGLDLVAADQDKGPDLPFCTPDDVHACTVVHGDGPHVMLVGDSQARMMGDAMVLLARQHHWTLSTSLVPGCSWKEGVAVVGQTGAAAAFCTQQRATLYRDVLPQLGVDVVILFDLAQSDPAFGASVGRTPTQPVGADLATFQRQQTEETVDRLTGEGIKVIVVHSMFSSDGFGTTGPNPLDCLATAQTLADCAIPVPVRQPAIDDVYAYLDVASDDVATLNVNPLVCPQPPLCSPVDTDGETLVWRDHDHVTARYFTRHRNLLFHLLLHTGLMTEETAG